MRIFLKKAFVVAGLFLIGFSTPFIPNAYAGLAGPDDLVYTNYNSTYDRYESSGSGDTLSLDVLQFPTTGMYAGKNVYMDVDFTVTQDLGSNSYTIPYFRVGFDRDRFSNVYIDPAYDSDNTYVSGEVQYLSGNVVVYKWEFTDPTNSSQWYTTGDKGHYNISWDWTGSTSNDYRWEKEYIYDDQSYTWDFGVSTEQGSYVDINVATRDYMLLN